jgi:hypothetical protein
MKVQNPESRDAGNQNTYGISKLENAVLLVEESDLFGLTVLAHRYRRANVIILCLVPELRMLRHKARNAFSIKVRLF